MKAALTVGALTLASATAWAAPPAPAWCKVDGKIQPGYIDTIREGKDIPRVVSSIAYELCNPAYVQANEWADLQAAYKTYSARLALTDAEWAEIAQFAAGEGLLELHPLHPTAAWSAMSNIDQYAYLQHPSITVPGLAGEVDYPYVADAYGAHLGELGRLGVITQCFARQVPVELAICQSDVEAFDFDKIVAEIRADKASTPEVHAILRLLADKARSQIPAYKKSIADLAAKDDAYKKMFEIAAQARKDWDAFAKTNADLIATQTAMDDAMASGSRKATAGCHEATWKALQTAIPRLPAKAFAVKRIPDKETELADDVMNRVIETLIGTPAGYLAASAFTECEELDPSNPEHGDNLAAGFMASLGYWSGFRGPRTAAYTALRLANLQLDDRNAKIDFPGPGRLWFHTSNATPGGSNGSVASVTVKGDLATVSFSQKLVKETVDTGCTQSNHVVGIRDNGSIEYEYNCTGSKVISVDKRAQPETVRARYVGGLKAGNAVLINTDIVWMTWPTTDASVPSFVLGQAVK